jgi:hypothetical protein
MNRNRTGRNAGFLLPAPLFDPTRPMPNYPIQECFLESNIVSRLLTFDPFMPKDLIPLDEEFLIEIQVFNAAGAVNFQCVHGEYAAPDFAGASLQIAATNTGRWY